MISNNLSNIEGVSIFQIIPLIIFITVFVGMVFYIIKMDKKSIQKMENLPLEENSDNSIEGN